MSYSTGYISISTGQGLITRNNMLAAVENWKDMQSTSPATTTTGQWDPRYNVTQSGRIVANTV